MRQPVEEAAVSQMNLRVNYANVLAEYYPGAQGNGRLVSVKENNFDMADIDLIQRVVDTGLASDVISAHAGEMATIIAGKGNSSNFGKGVAREVLVTSSDFNNTFPDPDEVFTSNNILLQNHSYGFTVPLNQYGAEAADYDRQMTDNPYLLHVISAGNIGLSQSSFGKYATIEGYANLSGSFKQAKNLLLVGAMDREGNIDPRNSRGPAYDGRLKPELVAYGQDGTSDAAALVSGISLVLQDYFEDKYSEEAPSSLIKSVLIAGAQDVGPEGIDFITGYGSVNALSSAKILEAAQFFLGEVSEDEKKVHEIIIPEGVGEVRIVLTWPDNPANAGDDVALVNDLDLAVIIPSGDVIFPWVLSDFPHLDSLTAPPVRKADHLNTNELVTIPNPEPGPYQIEITASALNNIQQYAIAFHFTYPDSVEWTYPLNDDVMEAGQTSEVRWHNESAGNMGTLSFRLNGGQWQTVADVPLSENYSDWNVPDTTAVAQLRMVSGNRSVLSSEFLISKTIESEIEFVCADGSLISWNAIAGVSAYKIFATGELDSKEIGFVSDTTFFIPEAPAAGTYVRVFPVFTRFLGESRPAYDYTRQGVNCYYRTAFSRNVNDNFVRSEIELSTNRGVAGVLFEKGKEIPEVYAFQDIEPGKSLYAEEDYEPVADFSLYRISVELQSGRLIPVSTANVYFPLENTFYIYPNPVYAGGFFTILTQPDDRVLRMLNLQGQVIRTWDILASFSEFDLPLVAEGLYFLQLISNSGRKRSFSLYVEN